VEFSGHSEEVESEIPAVCGGHRIVIVPPSAGREGFEFQMREIGQNLVIADRQISAVVEDRHGGIDAADRFEGPLVIIQQNLPGVGLPILLLLRIEPVADHALHAGRTAAGRL